MKTLVLGIGNLLLSDEGFGVHFVRHLEERYRFPAEVELFDGGTLGMMVMHKFEDAERVFIVDALAADGRPGERRRYSKGDLLQHRIALKLSPHQAGVQEMMMVSEMRGKCPPEVHFLAVIPASLESSVELSPELERSMAEMAEELVAELRADGMEIEEL